MLDKFFSKDEIELIYKQYPFFQTNSLEFQGTSPPDIFVGRFGYPKVNVGILAPATIDKNSYKLSYPEEWFKNQLSIKQILKQRAELINSRFKTEIKFSNSKLLGTMQELVMSSKPTDAEFVLKKKPTLSLNTFHELSPIANPAPLRTARLTENPSVPKRVDYLVSDTDVKAEDALMDLYGRGFPITSLINLLSAGTLGIKVQRKLVPSRWSITATDSTISENMLEKIRHYPSIDCVKVFSNYYLGNHYEFILIPGPWSFEVIEVGTAKQMWWQDHENVFKRKKYADSVTGAYYTNRLAVAEYLDKIKCCATVLVFREVRPEYFAPLGVGILRELSRSAFSRKPNEFNDLEEAFNFVNSRLKLNVTEFKSRSKVLQERKQQKTLASYFS